MKQATKLTRNQKEFITKHGLNAKEWMSVSENDDYIRIVNKNDGKIRDIYKK